MQKKFQPKPHIPIVKPLDHDATSINTSEFAIGVINTIRFEHGKNPISHDFRIDDLALARAKDMYMYGYLDHKNPHTGACPNNMKSEFGFDQKEFLIENAALYDMRQDLADPPIKDIVAAWMKSTGHKYTLLYYDHKAGGFACYAGYCVFLGVSNGGYAGSTSTECHTAKEGEEFFRKLANCSDQQILEYESLQKQFKEIRLEYDKIPSTAHSEIEYLKANTAYYTLESIRKQLESFGC